MGYGLDVSGEICRHSEWIIVISCFFGLGVQSNVGHKGRSQCLKNILNKRYRVIY